MNCCVWISHTSTYHLWVSYCRLVLLSLVKTAVAMGWGKPHQMRMLDEFYLCGNAIYVDKHATCM
jgi:hypothetical protein